MTDQDKDIAALDFAKRVASMFIRPPPVSAAKPDLAGLTKRTGKDIAGIYYMETEDFYLAEDVQALLDAHYNKEGK